MVANSVRVEIHTLFGRVDHLQTELQILKAYTYDSLEQLRRRVEVEFIKILIAIQQLTPIPTPIGPSDPPPDSPPSPSPAI